MLLRTMPTIADTIAPDTPPPTSWPHAMSTPPPRPRAGNQRSQQGPAGDAAERAGDRVAAGSQADVLVAHPSDRVSADRAAIS